MTNTSVSIDEFRSNLADMLGRVMYGKNRIIIKKYNREAAVLLSLDEYEKLLDPTKRLTKKSWQESVEKLDKLREDIPDIDPDVLESEVNRAVIEVRAEKKRTNV